MTTASKVVTIAGKPLRAVVSIGRSVREDDKMVKVVAEWCVPVWRIPYPSLTPACGRFPVDGPEGHESGVIRAGPVFLRPRTSSIIQWGPLTPTLRVGCGSGSPYGKSITPTESFLQSVKNTPW